MSKMTGRWFSWVNPIFTNSKKNKSRNKEKEEKASELESEDVTYVGDLGLAPLCHKLPQQREDLKSLNASNSVESTSVKLCTPELQDKLVACRQLIESICSSCNGGTTSFDDFNTYVPLDALEATLNRDVLHNLLQSTRWYNRSQLDVICHQFLRTIAVLIVIGWEEWESFQDIFYEPQDNYHNFIRGDERIPYDEKDLSFLSHDDKLKFHRYQHIFNHYIFTREKGLGTPLYEIKGHMRLPFTELRCVKEWDPSISRAIIHKNGVPSNKYTLDDFPKVVALKEFRKKEPFDKERAIHHVLQTIQAERRTTSIVVATTSYIDGRGSEPRYILMYKWASTDLEKLLLGRVLSPFFRSVHKFSSQRFTPLTIVQQLRGIAGALDFLHANNISHLDMKPENILIDELEGRNYSNETPSGNWMLADFGLSRLSNKQVGMIHLPDNPPFTCAPRDPGTYQAPEVLIRGGSCNDCNTDNWSLGAIITVCFVFMLGGPLATNAFQTERHDRYSTDQFYFQKVGGIPEPKNTMWDWLSHLVRTKEVQEMKWVGILDRCMRGLLELKREDRMSAQAAEGCLQQATQALAATRRQSPIEWEFDPSRIEVTEFGIGGSTIISPADSPESQVPRAVLVSRLRAQASTMLSQPSTFHGLSLLPNPPHVPIASQMSMNWVAVLYETYVLLFDLHAIINSRSRSPSQIIHSAVSPCLNIRADRGQIFFKAIRLKGDFLAIVQELKEPNGESARYVDVRRLLRPNESEPKGTVEKRGVLSLRSETYQDCFDVIISAQGTLALLFHDHVCVFENAEERTFSHKDIRTAAFSALGDYLCIWNREKSGRNWWRTYHLESLGGSSKCQYSAELDSGTISRSRFDGAGCQKPYLAHTADGCYFFAHDCDGKIWFLSLQENERIQSKVFELRNGAVVLPLSKEICVAMWRDDQSINQNILVSASLGVPTSGSAVQPLLESGLPIDFEGREHRYYDHLSTQIDATTLDYYGESGIGILHGFDTLELRSEHIRK